MNTFKLLLALPFIGLLGGCAGGDDLDQWMATESAGMKGRVDPLPPVVPFTPIAYIGKDMIDPFSPKPAPKKASGIGAPDLERKKEYLESFSLDNLSLVGVIHRHGTYWGLVRAPDRNVTMVRAGNHMGQNFGKIIGVTPDGLQLLETFQSAQGEWSQRDISVEIVQ